MGGHRDARQHQPFGTHEFMDLLDRIGAQAHISINVGSGTLREVLLPLALAGSLVLVWQGVPLNL